MKTWTLTNELDLIENVVWTCPENPKRLLGMPIGMYHCPSCGCMAIAGIDGHPHDLFCWLGLWDSWIEPWWESG